MKQFVYLLMFAVAFLLFKAFYLDSLPKDPVIDENTTVQAVESAPIKTVEPKRFEKIDEDNGTRTGWRDKKGMPIDRLGDSIADSLKDKIAR